MESLKFANKAAITKSRSRQKSKELSKANSTESLALKSSRLLI